MIKSEFAKYIRERVMETWGVPELAESMRASMIWTYRLVDKWNEDDIIEAAKWLQTWQEPRSMVQLWSAMDRWKWEKDKKTIKKSWQYAP